MATVAPFESRFNKIYDLLTSQPMHKVWQVYTRDDSSRSTMFDIFQCGLTPGLREILLRKESPSLWQLEQLGWDEQNYICGVYCKGLRSVVEGNEDMCYVGYGKSMGEDAPAKVGLAARRRSHEEQLSGKRKSTSPIDTLFRSKPKSYRTVFTTLWSFKLPSNRPYSPAQVELWCLSTVMVEAVLTCWLDTWSENQDRDKGLAKVWGRSTRKYGGSNISRQLSESIEEPVTVTLYMSPQDLRTRKQSVAQYMKEYLVERTKVYRENPSILKPLEYGQLQPRVYKSEKHARKAERSRYRYKTEKTFREAKKGRAKVTYYKGKENRAENDDEAQAYRASKAQHTADLRARRALALGEAIDSGSISVAGPSKLPKSMSP